MRFGSLQRRRKTPSHVRLVLAGLTIGSLLAGCGSSSPASPQTTVRSFLANWTHRDWGAMSRLVDRAPADFASINTTALEDLGVSMANYVAGTVTEHGDIATARVAERFHL